jgi:Flp pilus assembly protein TadD
MPTQNEMMAAVLFGQAMDAARMSENYTEVIRLFTEALQHAPSNGEIYHNRGMAYSSLERWREAISDFSRAISLSPHPSSYEQRGLAYYQTGDRDSAFNDWQKALRMDSRRTFAIINLAWLAIEEGQFQQAIELCSHAILIEQTNAKAYENRARAYLELGDRTRGLVDLQTSRELVASGRDTSDIDLGE